MINDNSDQGTLKVLIANKIDKADEIVVPHEEAR